MLFHKGKEPRKIIILNYSKDSLLATSSQHSAFSQADQISAIKLPISSKDSSWASNPNEHPSNLKIMDWRGEETIPRF